MCLTELYSNIAQNGLGKPLFYIDAKKSDTKLGNTKVKEK